MRRRGMPKLLVILVVGDAEKFLPNLRAEDRLISYSRLPGSVKVCKRSRTSVSRSRPTCTRRGE